MLTWQFGVADIAAARKRLDEAGVPFSEQLMTPSEDWTYRVLHARTPNGYHLLLEEAAIDISPPDGGRFAARGAGDSGGGGRH